MENQALFTIKKNETTFEIVKITSSKTAYDVIRQYYLDDINVFESMFILLLDRSNTTVGYAKISQGGIAGTVVDVKLIAKYCIDSLCSGMIMAHNHPSGNLEPSRQDKDITQKVKQALELLDVHLLDHLIVTENNFYSFSDNHII